MQFLLNVINFFFEVEPQVMDDGEDQLTEPKYISLSFGGDSTKEICGSLQYLFSLLECSERRYEERFHDFFISYFIIGILYKS